MHVAGHIASDTPTLDLASCRQAVEAKPKAARARLELAQALLASDDPAEALEQCSRALALQSDLRDAAWLLASILQRYRINETIDVSLPGLRAAFQFVDVDRQALSNAAIDYLKSTPPLDQVISRGKADGWDIAAKGLLKGKGRKLLQGRIFRLALSHGVNTDMEVEFLLTAFRRQLLHGPDILASRPVYEFACVLIRQCANNGYVFTAAGEERDRADALACDVDAVCAGNRATVDSLILKSLYQPLQSLIPATYGPGDADKVLPRALRSVLSDFLEWRRKELDAEIAAMTPITDETSNRVADQYRRAPYPRWLSLQAPEADSAWQRLANHVSQSRLDALPDTANVLIAGAGTCQQAVHAALAYGPRARVQAIDLSEPSLAYGAAMASRFDVANLRFATGDILQLGSITERFDIIECAGVLHHMADPFGAWSILVDRLNPGGLMQIGLYSAVARQNFEALAQDPEWPGPDCDDDGLRAYRAALMHRGPGETGTELTQSIDFFAAGDFRDLALHVQEAQCTIPEIQNFMAKAGLAFRGFILPPDVRTDYGAAYPNDDPLGTLEHWWAFEQAHPRTFEAMYMFWCQRRDGG